MTHCSDSPLTIAFKVQIISNFDLVCRWPFKAQPVRHQLYVMWPEMTRRKQHIQAEEREKDGRKLCSSPAKFNSHFFVVIMFHAPNLGLIRMASARAFFWDKLKYVMNKLFSSSSYSFTFWGGSWRCCLATVTGSEPPLCALGGERRAKFLSCEGCLMLFVIK